MINREQTNTKPCFPFSYYIPYEVKLTRQPSEMKLLEQFLVGLGYISCEKRPDIV